MSGVKRDNAVGHKSFSLVDSHPQPPYPCGTNIISLSSQLSKEHGWREWAHSTVIWKLSRKQAAKCRCLAVFMSVTRWRYNMSKMIWAGLCFSVQRPYLGICVCRRQREAVWIRWEIYSWSYKRAWETDLRHYNLSIKLLPQTPTNVMCISSCSLDSEYGIQSIWFWF